MDRHSRIVQTASVPTQARPIPSTSTSSGEADWPYPSEGLEFNAGRRPSWQEQLSSSYQVATPFGTSPRSGYFGSHASQLSSNAMLRLRSASSSSNPGGLLDNSNLSRSLPSSSINPNQSQPVPADVTVTFSSPFTSPPIERPVFHAPPLSPSSRELAFSPTSTLFPPSFAFRNPTPAGEQSLSPKTPYAALSSARPRNPSQASYESHRQSRQHGSSSSKTSRRRSPSRNRYSNQNDSTTPLLSPTGLAVNSSTETALDAEELARLQYRRRSVDVGILDNARGHQRSGRTSQKDASAAAFVPPDQLKAQRVHTYNTRRSKEALFTQHLTSILAHSLSLCAAGNVDPESYESSASSVESSSVDSSPRSSVSYETADSTAPPSSPLGTMLRKQRVPSFPSITPARRLELVEFLSSWAFDANELDQDELCECACIMFECLLLMDGLDQTISIARIRPLLLSLRSAYHSRNPYHNFAHAVDVTQACYTFLVKMGLAPPLSTLTNSSLRGKWERSQDISQPGRIGDIVRPMDTFALLVAAVGHDVGHPGLSNAYMINAHTPAAQVYQDKSVLENFHSMTLAQMLKLHGFRSLLEKEDGANGFRQVLLACVLATDMSRHFPFVAKFNELGARLKENAYVSTNVEEDRLVICSGLMKCADVSNPTRPHKVALQWSSALLEEWAIQAEIEADFNLPISVVTLDPNEPKAQAKSQVGFITLFTQPLFEAMALVEPSLAFFAEKGKEGRSLWESILASEQTPPTSSRSTTPINQELSTPKQARSVSSLGSTPTTTLSTHQLPPSKSFTSRLPPHRTPRPLKLIDATRTGVITDFNGPPTSASSMSSLSTSPGPPSFFDRASPMSTSTTASSWLSPSSVDDCVPLGDEECNGDCGSVTATCSRCAGKTLKDRASSFRGSDSAYFISPVGQSIWPPDPFRPRQACLQIPVTP